jgi:beta-glucosidase
LLAANITPVITLYHWDLPSALQGAWLNRATAQAFSAYTDAVTRRLGDRVKQWTTLNEPWCAAMLGYQFAHHAPGEANLAHALQAGHHLLLAHGLGVEVIRANVPNAEVSLVVNPYPLTPASQSEADLFALKFYEGSFNRWFIDPAFGRGYPAEIRAAYQQMGVMDVHPSFILPGDMELIGAPIDALGVNYYSRNIVGAEPGHEMQPGYVKRYLPEGAEVTDYDWEVYPHGLFEILDWLNKTYAPRSLFIAENGASYSDGPAADGRVHDNRRVSYLRRHFVELAKSIEAGLPVSAYFAWSLMDNFEWASGFSQRFGIVHVDYDTLKRTPKDSAYFYQQVIAKNAVEEI